MAMKKNINRQMEKNQENISFILTTHVTTSLRGGRRSLNAQIPSFLSSGEMEGRGRKEGVLEVSYFIWDFVGFK